MDGLEKGVIQALNNPEMIEYIAIEIIKEKGIKNKEDLGILTSLYFEDLPERKMNISLMSDYQNIIQLMILYNPTPINLDYKKMLTETDNRFTLKNKVYLKNKEGRIEINPSIEWREYLLRIYNSIISQMPLNEAKNKIQRLIL